MARLSKSAVAAFFVSGARPNQSQFEDLIDSYQDFNDFLQEIATALATKTGVVAVSGSATSAHALLPLSLGGTGEGSLASAQNALNTGGFAVLASANQFTSENTFISSATGSAENPAINLDRRAPGLGGQNLGVIRFKGRDSLLASTTYSKIGGAIVSTSAGGETGRLQFTTIVSGASADRFIIAGGMYSLAASGGDRGIGTINVQEIYDDGERVEATVLDTPKDTSTGTFFTFTAPFATVTRAIIIFDEVTLDGTEDFSVRVGDAGGIETSGYLSSSMEIDGDDTNTEKASTSGFIIARGATGDIHSGTMDLILSNATNNTWIGSHSLKSNSTDVVSGGGSKASLDTVLTTITLLDTGSDNFNGGEVNIRWYGY